MATQRGAKKDEVTEEAPDVVETAAEVVDYDAIKKRIAELRAEAAKNNTAEKARELLAQLPKTKTASQLGAKPMDYAVRVMAAQSSDNDILLSLARVRRALKNQGYGLQETDDTVSQLEEAYKI